MKLERIEESITVSLALVFGLGLAVICGYTAGNGDWKMPIAMIGLIIVGAFLLIARRLVWMLIPGTWMLTGKLLTLPLPFSVAQLCILLATGMYMVLIALKQIRMKPKREFADVWLVVVLAYLGTVFLRNPVGVEALGSDRVGGKPYFDVIIAYLGYWVMQRTVGTPKQVSRVTLFSLLGYALVAQANILAERFPSLGGALGRVYGGLVAVENAEAAALNGLPGEGSGRMTYLQGLGASLVNWACAKWRPVTLINPLHIWRFTLFMVGLTGVLLSGFRSNLMGVYQAFVISSYFYRGWGEVIRVNLLAFIAVVFLVAVQGNVVQLPLSAQRALSFLPGKWEHAAKSEADYSTEWRIEMWNEMLTSNKYIENKWLGDGFGFTHRQLEIMAANSFHGTNEQQKENLMIGGGVHSGPVSSIRFVGYVGLILFVVLIVLLAIRAVRLINRARGTPFFLPAIFFGTQLIVFPFNFLFVFGAYENDLPNIIFAMAMQQLLINSLDAFEQSHSRQATEIIQPPKARPIRPALVPARV